MMNIAELCGDIPPSIATAGKYSKQLFRKSGESRVISEDQTVDLKWKLMLNIPSNVVTVKSRRV